MSAVPASVRLSAFLLPIALCSVAQSHTWNVQVDGSGDAPTIQAAIDSSAAGDTVLVGPGTYTWTAQGSAYTHSMLSLKPGLVLRGTGAPSLTVLDAESRGRVALLLDVGDQVLIENLTFQNGRSRNGLAGNVFVGTDGGGLSSLGNSSPTIRDCVFRTNRLIEVSKGGAIYSDTTIRLQNCEFIENTSGNDGFGGGMYTRGRAEIVSCVFKRNLSGGGHGGWGSAICSTGGSLISQCLFEGNWTNGAGSGHGAVVETGAGLIEKCTFLGNQITKQQAGDGSAIACDAGCAVRDCMFVGNRASAGRAGGTIYCDGCTVEGSTFLLNEGISPSPHLSIAGVYFDNPGTLRNSIIAYSIGRAMGGQTTATIQCSNLYANSDGTFFGTDGGGNFSLDPRFCIPPSVQNVDVSLQASSPCAPGNHPDGEACGLIGADPVNCPPTAVHQVYWSQVKSLYRE